MERKISKLEEKKLKSLHLGLQLPTPSESVLRPGPSGSGNGVEEVEDMYEAAGRSKQQNGKGRRSSDPQDGVSGTP